MKKLKRTDPQPYRGADEAARSSLTVASGETVEVSDDTAKALMAEGGWQEVSGAEVAKPVVPGVLDEATGNKIDPETGQFVDPNTGEKIDPSKPNPRGKDKSKPEAASQATPATPATPASPPAGRQP
jgi:hypothetical protein